MMKENLPASAPDGIIEGRNAVTEALRAGTAIDKIYLLKGEGDSALGHIASAARERGIVVSHAYLLLLSVLFVDGVYHGYST